MTTQQNYSCLVLVEPDSLIRRNQTAKHLFERAAKVQVDNIKDQLKSIRRKSVSNMVSLMDALAARVAQLGWHVVKVDTAAQAADYVASLVGPSKQVAVNNSHTVLEIEPDLLTKGLTLINTYIEQFMENSEAEIRQRYFWELPSIPQEFIAEAFDNTLVTEMGAAPNNASTNGAGASYDVALLGVNVASQDGLMFFLQHSRNIGHLLRQSRKLILLLPVNRIVGDYEEALFQTKCVGAFGAASQLLRLVVGQEQRDKVLEPGQVHDGAPISREVHVILLDNGRSRIYQSKFSDILRCIGCRACLRRCPTSAIFPPEGRGYPGNYIWSFLNGRNESLEFCLQCGSCKRECPVEIDIPKLILEAKSDNPPNLWEGRAAFVMGNFSTFMSLARPIAGIANRLLSQKPIRVAAETIVGLSRERQLQAIQFQTFEKWSQKYQPQQSGKKIVYYPGCVVNFNDPTIGRSVVRVLDAAGHQVLVSKHRCCGMPRLVSGDLSGVRRSASGLLDILYPYVEDGYEIVASCPSCALTLRCEYPWLLKDSRAAAVAEKTHNLSHYLWSLHQDGKLPLEFKPAKASVVYHTPCHLRDQDDDGQAIKLLNLIPSLSAVSLERGCCGMSGTFGMKAKYYERSLEIVAPLIERITDLQPQLVTTDCSLCAMQLRDGVRRAGMDQEVKHPICILDQFLV